MTVTLYNNLIYQTNKKQTPQGSIKGLTRICNEKKNFLNAERKIEQEMSGIMKNYKSYLNIKSRCTLTKMTV